MIAQERHFSGNPNLLDNWYFLRPVNQRGNASFPADTYREEYTLDRWKRQGLKDVTIADDGLILTNFTGEYSDLTQTVEIKNTAPTRYTLSILVDSVSGGNWYIQVYYNNGGPTYTGNVDFKAGGLYSSTVEVPADVGLIDFRINSSYGNQADYTAKIIAVKFELGDRQTLAHLENGRWVLNEVPDYGEQLARCQRYYLVLPGTESLFGGIGMGMAYSDTQLSLHVPTPVTMRIKPTVTATGKWGISCNGGRYIITLGESGARVMASHMSQNEVMLDISNLSGLSAYHAVELSRENNMESYIELDANL